MSDLSNIGHAILIIGSMYLHFVYGLDVVVTVLLCLFSLATWTYAGLSKERKEYLLAYIEMLKAKADYYKRRVEK